MNDSNEKTHWEIGDEVMPLFGNMHLKPDGILSETDCSRFSGKGTVIAKEPLFTAPKLFRYLIVHSEGVGWCFRGGSLKRWEDNG